MHAPRLRFRRPAALLTTATLLLTMLAFPFVTQAASTLWVNDDATTYAPPGVDCNTAGYATIQAAVNAASPGDTINVCAGTYAGVDINKTLTVNGAKAGIDARTRATSGESIISDPCAPVQITADNVVLDGFTVTGSILTDPCLNTGIWTNPGFSGTNGGHQILNNIVTNNISGIELDSTCAAGPTMVRHNLITNNNNPGPGSGNAIQTNFGLCKATIDSNKFSGHDNSSVFVSSGGDDQQITVSNNELVSGTAERIIFGSVDASVISGNYSNGSTTTGVVRLFGDNNNITVDGNVLINGLRGIRVDNLFATNTNITANGNCIAGNSIAGLEVDATGHTGTLDATGNWWGAATGPKYNGAGPGTGDNIVDPDLVVDYMPFSTTPVGSLCPAPPPPTTPLTTHQQAMNGDQKVAQGSTLQAGFDFNMPGKHPTTDVGFHGTTVTFPATCASGTPNSFIIVVTISDQSYTDPANSSDWYPSGDQNAASTYQGSMVVPVGMCDPGALVRLQKGGTFSTNISSAPSGSKVSVRWHYKDVTGGGWSGTYSVTQ